MFKKFGFIVLISVVTWLTACAGAKPTPVYLPTGTFPSATSTSRATPTAPATSTAINQTLPGIQSTTQPTTVSSSITATSTAIPQPSPEIQPTIQPGTTSPTAALPSPDSPQVTASPVAEQRFPPAVALEPILYGFENPVYLTYASELPPWESWLFIVEKAGRILMLEKGQTQPVLFLDITDRVGSGGSEQGLLSVAFPPDFNVSGVFYVYYTDQRGDTVISRFRLMDGNPPIGDQASEQKILEIDQPASNHNGGQLKFGPDGYLYTGTGDGGRAGDPWGNAQNPAVLLGKMLRIDVAGTDGYRIPSDNPFVEWSNVRSEIWALGLRNPWRFSFDRATGDLYVADVGQNIYEEVDFQAALSTGGENYGWDIMEANHCFEPERDCDSAGLTLPVTEYDHNLGCSITGGYVYRGTRYPELTGVYFFGDFCSGRIWGLQQTPSGDWRSALLRETDIAIGSFGEDAAGELYGVGYRNGTIYRLVAQP